MPLPATAAVLLDVEGRTSSSIAFVYDVLFPYAAALAAEIPEVQAVAYDRQRAAELFKRLERLPEEARPAAVEMTEELRSWALCERVCDASEREASRNLERAAAWAGSREEHPAENRCDQSPGVAPKSQRHSQSLLRSAAAARVGAVADR